MKIIKKLNIMQNTFEILNYTEKLIKEIIRDYISVFDLWSIHPLDNPVTYLLAGNSRETEKFKNYLEKHASQKYAKMLIITIGVSEKNYPSLMLNTSKQYFKLQFPQYSEEYKGKIMILPEFLAKN